MAPPGPDILAPSLGATDNLTGLPSFPDPQTLRRFLLHAPDLLWEQMHRVNDRLLQNFIHLPDHRSRLIFDLDSSVVTVFGRQENAEVGYNPRYRGKLSYNPLLCIETNSSYLWDAELRSGNAGTWDGSVELLDTCFANVPPDIRELRVRADAGFGFNPVFEGLEVRPVQYAGVARLTQAFKRLLPGLRYKSVNRLSVAPKKGAILAVRKGPVVWLRHGHRQARRRNTRRHYAVSGWTLLGEVGLLGAVRFAFDFQDNCSFHKAIEESHRKGAIGEIFAPLIEVHISYQRCRALLVSRGDDLVEQMNSYGQNTGTQ